MNRTIADLSPEELAEKFDEIYQRLAPAYGYAARRKWAKVPPKNRTLMIAVCRELLAFGKPKPPEAPPAPPAEPPAEMPPPLPMEPPPGTAPCSPPS